MTSLQQYPKVRSRSPQSRPFYERSSTNDDYSSKYRGRSKPQSELDIQTIFDSNNMNSNPRRQRDIEDISVVLSSADEHPFEISGQLLKPYIEESMEFLYVRKAMTEKGSGSEYNDPDLIFDNEAYCSSGNFGFSSRAMSSEFSGVSIRGKNRRETTPTIKSYQAASPLGCLGGNVSASKADATLKKAFPRQQLGAQPARVPSDERGDSSDFVDPDQRRRARRFSRGHFLSSLQENPPTA